LSWSRVKGSNNPGRNFNALSLNGDVVNLGLAQLDSAPSVNFMKAPPGNDLKEYDGAWHARINDQWRLTFKWGESDPYDVLIEDPR
jgi:proteic killer suppression protein